MNKDERIKMVKAMEFITRSVNDECIFDDWLTLGVADGEIKRGDLEVREDDDLDYYIEDGEFSYLMGLFLRTMNEAHKSGGLYCDNVVSV